MSGSQKTVFITGASGFIGRNAVEYFKDRYQIIAPAHNELDLLSQEDTRRFFQDHEINYVIHCANIGGNRKQRNIEDIFKKNLIMFFNIAENERYFDRMIHLGSGAEYNQHRMPPKVNELHFGSSAPLDDYGLSKYIISKYIDKSENIYCLRLFGVFGRYEDYEYKFISNSIVKNLLHLPILIKQNVFFDWMYIDDLLPIIHHFLRNKLNHKAYNVASGVIVDLISIANLINEVSEFKSQIQVENPGLNSEYSADNSRLLQEMQGIHFHNMYESVIDLRDYYKSILHKIDAKAILRDEYAQYCKILPGGERCK
ncbi:GDP-L-fucose synthase [uncultured archaeon]|nr:GDP-L-fucose synthase [uncultured archaeon]